VINANSGWNANPQGKLEVALLPPGFLKLAAAAANPTVSQRSVDGKKYTVISFPVEQKAQCPTCSGVPYTVTGYIDSGNMVAKVETKIEDNLIGDMLVEQSYAAYKDFNGVKFPTHIVQKRAGLAWSDLSVADVKANPAAPPPPAAGAGRGGAGGGGGGAGGGRGGAAPPEGRGGQGRGAAPEGRGAGGAPPEGRGGAPGGGGGRGAAAAPTAKKLADGIYMITGGYRSVAVEMKDHIVLIEAPQSEQTTSTIIEEVKKAIPNKPIKYVVNTHTHSDHSGGLRAAVAETGATIITYQSNKPLFETWFANSRTLLMPDKLSQSEKKAKFEYMGEKKELKDSMNIIELYHLKGVAHAEDMIVAYLPKIKTVVEADAFNAPAANAPPPQTINGLERLFASELDRLKIDYTTIIPIHAPNPDREITKADLLKNIGKGD
jgi:glyoxylase-like metal-dependent hydrolase (beta-lactamase superfamily II)